MRFMIKHWVGASALALAFALTIGTARASTTSSLQGYWQGGYGPGQGGYGPGNQGGWDAPPQEYRDIQRQGFRDGIDGARKDFGNGRRPNVNNRDEYRHPNVPGKLRRDYKFAFRRGYDIGVQHTYNNNGGGRPRPY